MEYANHGPGNSSVAENMNDHAMERNKTTVMLNTEQPGGSLKSVRIGKNAYLPTRDQQRE